MKVKAVGPFLVANLAKNLPALFCRNPIKSYTWNLLAPSSIALLEEGTGVKYTTKIWSNFCASFPANKTPSLIHPTLLQVFKQPVPGS